MLDMLWFAIANDPWISPMTPACEVITKQVVIVEKV